MAYLIKFYEQPNELELVQYIVKEFAPLIKEDNSFFRAILEWCFHSSKRNRSYIQLIKLRLRHKVVPTKCTKHYYGCVASKLYECEFKPTNKLSEQDQALFNDTICNILDANKIRADVMPNGRYLIRKDLARV